MLNLGPLKSTELFSISFYLKPMIFLLTVSGLIKLTPFYKRLLFKWPLGTRSVAGHRRVTRVSLLPWWTLAQQQELLLLQRFCSSLYVRITQIFTGIACSLGFRPAFQIAWSAKELIFIFYRLSEQRTASRRLHPTPRRMLLSSALNFQF